MIDTVPRLLIVAADDTLSVLIRAAFELMGRRCRLVTVSTAVDAFDELGIRVPDLLLTAYQLADDNTGLELAVQAREALPALPIILITDEATPEQPIEEGLTVLMRPCPPERLLRALRAALNEPDDASLPIVATEDLGPVPSVNIGKLQPILIGLTQEVGAASAAFADRTGRVLFTAGSPAYIDLPQVALLIRPATLNTAQLIPLLGDRMRTLSYYDGSRYDVFSLGIGLHHFIYLVFDSASGERALGPVRRYGTSAADKMLQTIGEIGLQISIPSAPEPPVLVASNQRPVLTARGAPEPVDPGPSYAPPVEIITETIEGLDMTLFDAMGQFDSHQADDLFNPDRLESLINTINNEDDGQISGLVSQPG